MGVNLLPDAVARLGTHPNIVGMKESGATRADCRFHCARPTISRLAGSAATVFAALCVGCDGAILALAQLAPEACVLLQALVREGHVSEARELQSRLIPLARTIGGQHGVPALKAALNLMGYAGGRSATASVRSLGGGHAARNSKRWACSNASAHNGMAGRVPDRKPG